LALSSLGKPARHLTNLDVLQFIDHSTGRCEADCNGGGLQIMSVTILNFVPMILGLLAAQPGVYGQSVTRLIVQDEVILRVPIQPRPFLPQFEWKERKGPKCIPTIAIQRALLSGDEQVDFVLAGRGRIRAKLEDNCPALDFYGGFYLQSQDDRLCAHRDAIHSRMGGSCTIDGFKQLVPKLRR
jgi:hypothetical protein